MVFLGSLLDQSVRSHACVSVLSKQFGHELFKFMIQLIELKDQCLSCSSKSLSQEIQFCEGTVFWTAITF